MVIGLCCVAASACGGSGTPAEATGPAATSTRATTAAGGPEDGGQGGGQGPDLGLCGSVTDAEVEQATGLPASVRIVKDPVGCQWDAGELTGGSHVSFTWYRGSPSGRERAIDEAVGRTVSDVTIGGRPGFASRLDSRLCEVAVTYGDDFFLWSVAYGGAGRSDACDAAKSLAAMTAQRAG